MDISIIVPFLNEERYIRRCIESLLDQDFDRGRYEVIFIDNGSSDASAEIVQEFPAVRLLTEEKGKVYTARNTGIGVASGKIIAFTDADCVVSGNWLSSIHDAIAVNGATIVLGSTVFPSPKSALLQIIETYRNDHIDFVIQKGIKGHLYAYTNNMAVRADIFERVGLFAELPVPGDTEIVHRCLSLIPETRLEYRPEMQIEHLELLNVRILLRKIYLYGEFDTYLEIPDYDEPPRRKTSGAEAHCAKKNAFSLWERILFQIAVRSCNACFRAGQLRGRFLRRFRKGERGSETGVERVARGRGRPRMGDHDAMSSHRRGAYFMSDDRILDLTIAFLNSFRAHNPEIPLRLIPYDENTDRVRRLESEYDFTVYDDADVLSACDDISVRFHGRVLGQYRKLAMWEGTFDEFVYIDSDTVVLGDVDFVFAYLEDHDFVTSHSNFRTLRQYVWKKSIWKAGILTREQITYSANTGFIASKRGALELESARDAAKSAERLTPHMVLYCVEQPFLNYLIVTSGKRYTSLRVLEKNRDDPRMRVERWAGERWGIVRKGGIRFPGRRPPVLLLHWAGKWQPTATDRRLRSLLGCFGMKERDGEPVLRCFMPYRRLWEHYRFLRERERYLREREAK